MYHKIIHIAIKRNGGVLNTLVKSLNVLKQEGFRGVIHRVFQIKEHNQKSHKTVDGFYVNDYGEWIRRYDTLTSADIADIKAKQDEFTVKPLISVLLPVYNPNPKWLKETLDSVLAQTYTNWELCIADDASTNPEIKKILLMYQKNESRIKLVFREQNGHISACSNSALEIAAGDFVTLLDHDDLLSEHALYWVTKSINMFPDGKLYYSDEDKVDEFGVRSNPYFKSDWNYDLLLSQNFISHLGVYQTKIIKQLNGFRVGLEGSQDHDLVLRFIEKIDKNEIVHIPKVLYHWRLHSESTSKSVNSKSYATVAGVNAINDHFDRCGIEAKAEVNEFAMYRVKYKIPSSKPLVSLIIPTYNGLHLLRKCIKSITEKTTYSNYEIIIIDNNSDDKNTLKYLEEIQREPQISCLRDGSPFNFSALYNRAIKFAKGEFIGMINNDIEVITPTWLEEMVSIANQPKVGAVGAKLYFPNKTIQHAGIILGIDGVANHPFINVPHRSLGYFCKAKLIQEYTAVTAACLLIRKSVYLEVGGLNETHLAIAYNDVDFCLKIKKAGYRNVWTPYAELYHYESSTRGYENTPEKLQRLEQEKKYMINNWSEIIDNDPAYNPNLTLLFTDFSFSWPPRIDKY